MSPSSSSPVPPQEPDEQVLKALREAVRSAPDNVALRQHLADTLLNQGLAADAEKEYRDALVRAPGDSKLMFGLATAFCQEGKHREALVLIEEVVKSPQAPARAHMLNSQLLLRAGAVEDAVRAYRKATDLDPLLADETLSARLGIGESDGAGEVVDGKVRQAGEDPGEGIDAPVERPRISFKDVGGMESLKEEIRMKIILPLKHPEMFEAYGKKVGGGILLYGPPGCGKTHLARATAGEIQAGFLAVGIADVLDMWIGNSERNLHELFEQARQRKPCVLFFDEVDALGASRSDMRKSGGRHLINQFLSELDGVDRSNEGVLILAATNAPWHLDTAFRRPGRFDRVLFVPPPDATARAAILQIHCQGKPMSEVDYAAVAKQSEHFSGADLKGAVDVAVEQKLKVALREGKPQPITTRDLLSAAKAVKPSTREWFSTARNYALYSNQSGLYDDILKHLK
jgi:AAA+ superfamily predicted ATPase